MAITGIYKCYFVTFTKKKLHYEIVDFDDLRWERAKHILKNFFYAVIFPEVINDNIGKSLKAAIKECVCKSERNVTFVKCSKCIKRSRWSCHECKINVLN